MPPSAWRQTVPKGWLPLALLGAAVGVAADRAEGVVAAGMLVAAGAGMAVGGTAVGWNAGTVGVASVPHAIATNNRMNASKERRLMLPPMNPALIVSRPAPTQANQHRRNGFIKLSVLRAIVDVNIGQGRRHHRVNLT